MSLLTTVISMVLLFQQGGKLQQVDVKQGTGRAAQANDLVTVEYTGTLKGGKAPFDSSKGKAPFVFKLGAGEVIKGWDIGVVGMKVGGKRKLTIPADLGYGQTGAGNEIPPNSTLVFEIELLRIDREGDKQDIEIKRIAEGKGDLAKEGDQIDVHYRGKFLNGVGFDNSYDRGQPLHITVGQERLIKGFVLGMKDMRVGDKRVLTIPSSLGYGAANRGTIPPNSTLVFEIEAVKITTKAELAEAREKEIKLLKIEELEVGTGQEAKDGDSVEVHYTGTFPDGKKFDSSKDRGQAFNIKLGAGQVIKGFDYGIAGMKVGGKRRVTIPPQLGYGAAGAGGVIPPNATIIFEIELISVKS